MNRVITFLLALLLLPALAGCLGSGDTNVEPSLSDAATEPPVTATPLNPDDPLVRDAASFAEHEGLSLEEAARSGLTFYALPSPRPFPRGPVQPENPGRLIPQ